MHPLIYDGNIDVIIMAHIINNNTHVMTASPNKDMLIVLLGQIRQGRFEGEVKRNDTNSQLN